jgi:hypothetical protein
MGEYFVGAKSRQVTALLKKCGLKIIPGSRHDKAVAPSGRSVPVPRHKSLSNGEVEDICNFLIEEGYAKSIIDEYIKK